MRGRAWRMREGGRAWRMREGGRAWRMREGRTVCLRLRMHSVWQGGRSSCLLAATHARAHTHAHTNTNTHKFPFPGRV